MQTNYIKNIKRFLLICFIGMLGMFTFLTSCEKDDQGGSSVTELLSYGPMPVQRGAELRFIGENLDNVTSIILPEGIELLKSEFTEHTATSIKLIVSQDAVEGYVELVYPEGSIVTKTAIGFDEPISLNEFAPINVKPGAELTLTGDYLNRVGEIIFTDRVVVDSADFVGQSRKEIKLIVPAEAQTGKLALSNGAEDPIIIYSTSNLAVVLPAISSVGPNPVKVGTDIIIKGADLDLVQTIVFGGDKEVSEFTTQSETEITLTVPMNAEDGKISLIQASSVAVVSAEDVVMVDPTLSVAPTTIKPGQHLVVTGTNLDLISKVVFASGSEGVIEAGGSDTKIMVAVPDAALSGEVVFTTTSNKMVSGGDIIIVAPSITSFSPAASKPNTDLVILGADLDVVNKVVFSGGIAGEILSQSETQLTITIPVGAQTGAITLVAINGVEVMTITDIEVLQNLPNFGSYGENTGVPGKILTIHGTMMDLIKELVFPGDIVATAYGEKNATKVEVYVPMDAAKGYGQIKMITYEGEEGFFPEVFIGSTDPITSETLMISNFDGGGASQSTWGTAVTFGQPAVAFDGTDAMLGAVSSGWQWGWAQNWDTRPTILNPEDYVIKFDICIVKDAPDVEVGMKLKGSETSVNLGKPFVGTTGGQWITMTFDVLQAGMSIDGTNDWGIFFNGGDYDLTGIMIDNLRFDPK